MSKFKGDGKMKCNPNNSCVDCKQGGVNIKITNKCNANCSFCVEKGGLVTEEKSVETLITATNSLDNYENLLILGGEPLLYPNLEGYLKNIKNKNIFLTTNGTLLTDDMAEMLSKYLTGINISIHHFKENVNADIFKLEDYSFLNIISAIKIFNKNNIPVRINCNLIKGILDNEKDIMKMIYFAQFIGANNIRLAELQNCEDSWVDSSKIFKNLPDNPYEMGCEQLVYTDDDFKATIKMTCGFVNNLKPMPNDPNRKQTERKVIYPDGEVKNGWYNIRDGKAVYHGTEQPVKVKYETQYVSTSTNSCY